MRIHETGVRSLAKALTFRLMVLLADSVIVYAITRRFDITLGVLIISNISSTILYFLHERIWNQIHWERHHLQHHR